MIFSLDAVEQGAFAAMRPGADLGAIAASVGEIWNSDAYRAFREQHAHGNYPGFCEACYRPESARH